MSKTIISKAVRYHQFGDPRKVLQLDKTEVPTDLKPTEVLVKWLASPVNPLDINLVEGNYAIRNQLPSVGGAEGVGRVEKVGTNVSNLKTGDHVLSLSSATWAEFGIAQADNLLKIRKEIDLISAAQLLINPPTAYCMLKFYEDLKPGDFIIQNAANSGVGRAVIQLANAFGLKSINLVRDRSDIEELRKELKSLGADYVFSEKEFAKDGRKFVGSLKQKIKLACNGVGGRSALTVSATLSHSGTCVTYGGMSKQPHEFSTGALVFKNLKAVGYSNGMWLRDPKNLEKRNQMYEELQDLILAGKLKPTPVQTHQLENFAEAIQRQMDGKHGKQLLYVSEPTNKSKI